MTLYASVNGNRVFSGSFTVPFYGTWEGDAGISLPVTLKNPASLVVGNLTLSGSVYRQGVFAGETRAHLVGGGGGWGSVVRSQGYTNTGGVSLTTVLNDVATIVGEKVNVQPNSGQPSIVGQFFTRVNAPASTILSLLAGPEWYVDTTGVTQIGPRASSLITSPFTVVEYDPGHSLFEIATEDPASWMPGNTFSSPTVPVVQTISMTRIDIRNDGIAVLKVLGTA